MEKYGFVYLWYDRKHKRYYIGCHWGNIHDGYICSSNWMRTTYNRRPQDFRRRIIKTNLARDEMYVEEQRYLNMIKESEIKPKAVEPRYYNLCLNSNNLWHKYEDKIKLIGEKISKSKTGKSVPCSSEKAKAISKAKRGKPLTEEHKQALRGMKKKPHTDEWKEQNSIRLKEQWENGTRQSNGTLSEEHRQKISEKNKGRKLKESQVKLIKHNASKNYKIEYSNGSIVEVHGLKQYASDNDIPYVTLFKASQQGIGSKKYNINSIVRTA